MDRAVECGRAFTTSICLPTFNGERYLREQLESFAAQEVVPDELIVGDDASTDGTIKVIKAFAEHAPMAVMVSRNGERLGLAANLKALARRASAEVVFFSDQDDLWRPDKIRRSLEPFKKDESIEAVASDSRPFDSATGRPATRTLWEQFSRGTPPGPTLREVVARRVFLPGHNLAVKRRALVEHLWPDGDVWPDLFCALVFAARGTLALVDETLVLYRQHDHNTIGVRGRHSRPANVTDWTRSADTLAAVRVHIGSAGGLSPEDAALLLERERFLRSRVEFLQHPLRHAATPFRLAISRRGYAAYANGLRSLASDLATLAGRR